MGLARRATFGTLLLSLSFVRGEVPRDSGLHEKVQTRLVLFDVTVTDPQGRPVRGLGRGDFSVTIDGREWPIVAVDDFCSPEAPSPAPAAVLAAAPTGPAPAAVAPSRAPAPLRRFVLFFDFHELTLGGRLRALASAERWVREVRRDGELTAVYAFGSERVKLLSAFTNDAATLLSVLDAARNDPELIDPYPNQRLFRGCCAMGGGPNCPCAMWAAEDAEHSRPTFGVMRDLLDELRSTPGSKELLLFHDTLALNTYAAYHVEGVLTPTERISMLDDVAAAAAGSRTRVHTVYVGTNLPVGVLDARNFGHNAADLTGGTYNRTLEQADALLGLAGRHTCTYTVAIRPPEPRHRLRWVRIRTRRGDVSPGLIYARFQAEGSLFKHRAQTALAGFGVGHEVPVTAALVPRAADGNRWTVDLQVAVPITALGHADVRRWGAGALLWRLDGRKTWEFESFGAVKVTGQPPSRAIVHERTESVDAGEYRLSVYAGDLESEEVGDASDVLLLPGPGADGITRPVLLLTDQERIVLPLTPTRNSLLPAGHVPVTRGTVPLGGALARGRRAAAVTMICPREAGSAPSNVRRELRQGADPVRAFGPPALERAGRCWRLVDALVLPTGGEFTYRVEWTTPSGTLLESSAVIRGDR